MHTTTQLVQSVGYDIVQRGKLHSGGALRHLVSKYPDLMPVLKEAIQNAIDSGATKIQICVDFDRHTVMIRDNGNGTDQEFFGLAINTIGLTVKSSDKYGKFGIGLMAPLSVSTRYTFTSRKKGGVNYLMWAFDKEKLFKSSDGFDIPCKQVDSGQLSKNPSEKLWWNTEVYMHGLTEDKRKGELNLDDLTHEIQGEFSKRMLEFGIYVTIMTVRKGVTEDKVIKGKSFQGKKLDEWTSSKNPEDQVSVQMYLSPPGSKGAVRVLFAAKNDIFRLTWQKFAISSGCKYLSEETRNALASGIFQGEIVSNGITLTATRRSFEDDDALMALGVALDEWFTKIGSKYLTDEKGKRARERYQVLGSEVLNSLSWMYSGENAVFQQIVARAEFGSVGKGHAAPPKGTLVPGYSLVGSAKTPSVDGPKTGPRGPRTPDVKDKPNHIPKVAVGDSGSLRLVVKGHSQGPHILYSDFDGSSALWKFDSSSLCLQVNTTHPDFVMCEKSDYKVKALTEQIFLTAFQLELEPADYRLHAEKFAAVMLSRYAELLQKGTVARKVPGSAK